MTQKFHEPFSPAILETEVTKRFIKIVNDVSDDVLSSEEKSKKWDWSNQLVGKVSKEVLIPLTSDEDKQYLLKTVKQGCLDYLNHMLDKHRNNPWTRMDSANWNKKPTLDNIHLDHSWVVSQYAGEFNPFHHHNADFSAGIVADVIGDIVADIVGDIVADPIA